jgi:hypothetical protein
MNAGIIFNPKRYVKIGISILGLALVSLAMACSTSFTLATEDRDDSFTVGDSPRLVVNNTNGRIIVNPGTDDTIKVQTTLKKPDDLKYDVTQSGDTISVEVKNQRSGVFHLGRSTGADIEITAPPNTTVELRTSNGKVEIYGMQRSGTLRTSNSKIVMEDVSGDFVVVTSNGKVTITRAIGTFDVETSNGRIEFNGEIVSGGNNSMTTSNGSVEITLLGTPSVELDASTSNGSVTTSLPILTTNFGDEHHIVGTIGSGDADLFVRSSNGSVTVQ